MGKVRSRRYRNRRLGEFLKELELTEGRSTGIPTIIDSLKANGSPKPRFYTDEERTFFEVELFIHPAFRKLSPISLDLDAVDWNFEGANNLIEKILLHNKINISKGIAGGIVEADINNKLNTDIQVDTLVNSLNNEDIKGIAKGIARGIAENTLKLLKEAVSPKSRKELLKSIDLTNNANNFENHIQPMVALDWLKMTIPDKPTSPKQQYVATLKGRLIIKIVSKR